MLHLIPPPLHRAALRLAHALRKVWWRVGKPRLSGCRVLARDAAGRVLLVRHCYGSGRWMLPGGGMKRGEDPLLAAARELQEEVGCRLEDPVVVMVRAEALRGATNHVHIVAGFTADTPQPDRREIAAAQWFAADALPDDLAPGQREGIPAWVKAAEAAAPRAMLPGSGPRPPQAATE